MDVNEPLPYYSGLAKVLHGPTLALVLTYLEFHHPAQQDAPDGLQSLAGEPIIIDCDVVSAALGVSRRTLHIALSCLGSCWSAEEARVRAARVGREFFNPAHSLKPQGHDPVKCYSFTGSKEYNKPRSLAMRRNQAKLADILIRAGIIAPDHQFVANVDICGFERSLHRLPDILHSVLPDWGDRRAERWERWRRETGRKSSNPGRMAGVDQRGKKSITSTDSCASDYAI